MSSPSVLSGARNSIIDSTSGAGPRSSGDGQRRVTLSERSALHEVAGRANRSLRRFEGSWRAERSAGRLAHTSRPSDEPVS